MDKPGYLEADDFYDIACQWKKEKEWEKAIESYRHVIELNRYFIYAYIDLSEVYAFRGEYHDAVSVLKKAIKHDPQFHLLYYNAAKYLYKCGDIPGAAKYIDEAINLNDIELYRRVKCVIQRNKRL